MANENNENLKGVYSALFAPTRNCFWRAASSSNAIACDVQWVQTHELYNISVDEESGATIIQSNNTKKFVEVGADNKLYARQEKLVQGTKFKVDSYGGIKAFNGAYIEVGSGNLLAATGRERVAFRNFTIKTIAITDIDSHFYACRGTVNGKSAIRFDSKTPVQFFWLCDEDGDSYFETEGYEFFFPTNSTDAITYNLTPIDQKNYRITPVPIEGKPEVYGLKSQFNGKYFSVETIGSDTVITCGADDCKGLSAQFRLSLIK